MLGEKFPNEIFKDQGRVRAVRSVISLPDEMIRVLREREKNKERSY
jgi:hypothetical protein